MSCEHRPTREPMPSADLDVARAALARLQVHVRLQLAFFGKFKLQGHQVLQKLSMIGLPAGSVVSGEPEGLGESDNHSINVPEPHSE